MLKLAIGALAVILFLLFYATTRYGLSLWLDRQSLKLKLRAYQQSRWGMVLSRAMQRLGKPHAHIVDLLLSLRWRIEPKGFLLVSIGMALFGIAAGVLVFQSIRSVAALFLILGCTPYMLLRFSLINRQMATRLEFLPAVELFYQCYLVTGSRHVRTALQKTVEERRLTGEVQAVFEQLFRNLSVHEDDEGSLRRFSMSFGHTWADYFANIVKVSLEEGNNIAENIKELVADMRKAQLANQLSRHRLLEIRIANFAPVVFLSLFLGINFRLNPVGSYTHYLLDATGRSMLLNAVILLFGSFVMGLYLSRRKI